MTVSEFDRDTAKTFHFSQGGSQGGFIDKLGAMQCQWKTPSYKKLRLKYQILMKNQRHFEFEGAINFPICAASSMSPVTLPSKGPIFITTRKPSIQPSSSVASMVPSNVSI